METRNTLEGKREMKLFKVETNIENADRRIVRIHGWVDAETHLDAAVKFKTTVLANPRTWCDPIMVVERDTYVMGNYDHEAVDIASDYEVGLRE